MRVLLIEDNEDDALIIRQVLAEARGAPFDLEWANRLSTGLERLTEGGFDVILLDLTLPDSRGLDTLRQVHAEAPDVPILVLTGLDDETLGVKAVQEGAQDYLVKGQVDGNLLVRAMRYGMERQQRQVQLAREVRSLERLSRPPSTTVTAELYGVAPLRESMPDMFNTLVRRYGGLLDLALEQRAYRVEHNISEELRTTAEQLGFLKAGPRDVVEVHTTALKTKTDQVTPQKAQAYAEEGRLMILELMGYLVSYYRTYSGGRRARAPEASEQ